ncbi:phage head closure protein [Bacillus velezensis]|uniref:Phage head-tail adaptor n=1 Tax=Bacillus amyloliquefaciens (strain ATCC 23350 / DSM 7 / BCRC 11601 / CCUG 28519 / NBRC 15535 / NRRL B-14393 / F) TaxID=692420 RepID=A0A9P1NGH0_BACAS|nr:MULTISPECIES: phage head closure protein [Bacillus subtilis group]SLB62706.1 Bacteriophage head-tail adaptor [Mycobacteroides abscessus subsp. massiliense]AYK68009.1 head-tail adaptor protein [Bacillus subtilis subsp. subtilis]AZV88287.1 head-tail adaptor protein [Bacillus amyloliquefaciens]EYB35392.1 head-tail adaptor protein [Bacillus amyloliquefaciens EBL11]MDM5202462.1 phage head closure protein [Bacillus velezensis]
MPIAKTGDLNERITFNVQKSTKINGVPKMGPVEVATVWAAVWRQRLKDRINNLGEGIANKITFVVRQNLPFKITNDMTITHKGTEYKIVDIEPDTVNYEWKTIICEAIT